MLKTSCFNPNMRSEQHRLNVKKHNCRNVLTTHFSFVVYKYTSLAYYFRIKHQKSLHFLKGFIGQ